MSMHLFPAPQILTSREGKMKQPTSQEERNRDKKDPEQNPSRGIDPASGEKEMEVVDQDPGHRQKENQSQKKDDDLAA
jgi:hypothetical protein